MLCQSATWKKGVIYRLVILIWNHKKKNMDFLFGTHFGKLDHRAFTSDIVHSNIHEPNLWNGFLSNQDQLLEMVGSRCSTKHPGSCSVWAVLVLLHIINVSLTWFFFFQFALVLSLGLLSREGSRGYAKAYVGMRFALFNVQIWHLKKPTTYSWPPYQCKWRPMLSAWYSWAGWRLGWYVMVIAGWSVMHAI